MATDPQQTAALQLAAERIRRFKKLGGVDLSRLDPEEKDFFTPTIHVGYANYKKAVFRFRCPMCGNIETNDQEMEPVCTGPSWTNDHPLEIMELIRDE